jgi:DNA processing protein
MIATRGCPGQCTFCFGSFLGKKIRMHSPDYLIEEIKYLQKNYGIKEILFYDDTFTTFREKVKEFCSKIIQQKIDITWVCFSRVDTIDEDTLKLMKKAGCHQIMYGIESGSEEILKNINNPPIVLYVMGEIKDMPSVSIVGTRHPTDYGAKNTAKISYDLARIGLRVVSGLARGIDTVAHKAAIKAKGVTIAVIGSGLNNIYPPENKELAEIISSNRGAVISEYPLFSKPLKNNFPRRNRIISALSFATLVIEGDFNSGALITARYAVEQGREVMALPGSVDSRFSNGPNSLIKEGAYLVRNAKDIIELIPSSELFDIDLKKLYKNEEKEINLSPKGNIVYEFLKTKKEATVDEISAALNIEISELFNYLFELETSGAVTLFAGKYKINI